MATSGSFTSTKYKDLAIKFSWELTSQSIADNTSVISWSISGYRTDNATGSITCGNFKVVIDGTIAYSTGRYDRVDVKNGTVIATGTHKFDHNIDGTKSFTVELEAAIYEAHVSSTGSTTFTLNQIPRASTFDSLACSTKYFDGKFTYKYTPQSASYYNRCTVALVLNGSLTTIRTINLGKLAASQQTGTLTLTETELSTIYNKITTSASGTLRFTIGTYSDSNYSNVVGAVATSDISLSIPENDATKPNLTATYAPVSELASSFDSVYVQSKSKVKATPKAIAKYGASITQLTMSVGGKSYGSVESFTSDYLTQYGTTTVTITAKDSRGFTSSISRSIEVIAYSSPKIEASAYRCDENGNRSDSGTYLKIEAKRTYAKVMSEETQHNYCLIRYRYKLSSENSYSEWEVILSRDISGGDTVTTGALLGGTLSVASSYQVQVQAVDDVAQEATTTFSIATDSVYWHRTKNALGLGKYSEKENTLDMGWDIELNGNNLLKNGVVPFAPDGYGLGPAAITVSNWDNAVSNGYYQGNKGGPIDGTWFYGHVHAYDDSGKWVIQKVWCNQGYNGIFCSAERRCAGGTWGKWRWSNPPMELGVEYCLTECHDGKEVYVTRLIVGTLLNKGTTQTSLPSTPTEIVEIYGTAKSDAYTETVTFPILTASGAVGGRLNKTGTKDIAVKTFADYSGYVATATVKYTKD